MKNIFLLQPSPESDYFAAADYNVDGWKQHRQVLLDITEGSVQLNANDTPDEFELLTSYFKIRHTGYDRINLNYLDWAKLIAVELEPPAIVEGVKSAFKQLFEVGVHDLITNEPRVFFTGSPPSPRSVQTIR